MKLVVGLGNPGRRYRGTRHNAGWMAVERLAENCGARPETASADGALARCGELWLFKPLAYMNRSGPPVARLLEKKGVAPSEMLVVLDDLNLPLGTLRLRTSGSSGGHNGLESVIRAVGTEDFPRLRLGIGPCPAARDMREFVLSPFADEEWDVVEAMTDRAEDALLCWSRHGVETAMNRHNRKVDKEPAS